MTMYVGCTAYLSEFVSVIFLSLATLLPKAYQNTHTLIVPAEPAESTVRFEKFLNFI